MRSLKESLLTRKQTSAEVNDYTENYVKTEIKKFIVKSYHITDDQFVFKSGVKKKDFGKFLEIEPDGDDFIVNASVSICLDRSNMGSLTNGMFRWGMIDGSFSCGSFSTIKTLEGGPKEVTLDYSCAGCKKIKDLTGSPEKVGRDFYCTYCTDLRSLEGSPKEVGGDFNCSLCKNLKNKSGISKKIGGEIIN